MTMHQSKDLREASAASRSIPDDGSCRCLQSDECRNMTQSGWLQSRPAIHVHYRWRLTILDDRFVSKSEATNGNKGSSLVSKNCEQAMRRLSYRNSSDQQVLAASSVVFTENTKTTAQRNSSVTRNRGSRRRQEAKDRAEEDQATNNDAEAEEEVMQVVAPVTQRAALVSAIFMTKSNLRCLRGD